MKFIKIRGSTGWDSAAEEIIINIEEITVVRKAKSGGYPYAIDFSSDRCIFIDTENAQLLFSYMGIYL